MLQSDDEFRQLATQHHDLDEKIHDLAIRHYLSEPEQLEEVTLKKRKLQLKDQMEIILRQHSHGRARRRPRAAADRRSSPLFSGPDARSARPSGAVAGLALFSFPRIPR